MSLLVLLILAFASTEVSGITIPTEWQELLRRLCEEIEGSAVICPPVVRDVLTFQSVSTVLATSCVVSTIKSS
jgi:hypothetical protein